MCLPTPPSWPEIPESAFEEEVWVIHLHLGSSDLNTLDFVL